MSSAIEDYGLIGDGQTTALVNREGSVDWLCWPRFDSDACFAALLGDERHGSWSFSPKAKVLDRSRRYEEDTLVLQTDAACEGGSYRITDFMPLRDGDLSSLVRIVEGLDGTVELDMTLRLRFAYGTMPPWCEATERGVAARIGPDRVSLDAPVPVTIDHDTVAARFTLSAGQRLCFVLSYSSLMDAALASAGRDPSEAGPRLDPERALAETRDHWRAWIGRFDERRTRWPSVVKRSLITLKAMAHHVTGGLVAAPTTSLPEVAGGHMNWDYRYCWLRDASFTLGAFVNAGFTEEATAWRDWLLRAVGGAPDKMQIMYRLDGGRHLDEYTVDELPGYRDARPVLIGNAAAKQHQIDVYGEVLDCLDFARRAGIPITPHHVAVERRIVDHLESVWDTPGSGIWESRDQPRQYTYSKAMAWAGFDRAVRDGGSVADEAPDRLDRLRALRDRVHAAACREGWNEGLGTFTQAYGNEALDASLLLLPLVGFLPADDPRMAATIARIGEVLSEGGLIRRQKAKVDGPNEGAFLACSCWMADCLNLQGRHAEAVAQFERLLAVGNDLGLYAEEYNVPARHMTGNFPQALTHLAIVNTALSLCGPVLTRDGSSQAGE
jgi:GH15 family glucan-1,4-alpha-glucosidase